MIVFIEGSLGLRLEGARSICRLSRWGRLSYGCGTVGVEHLCFEGHFGRLVGKLVRELEGGFKKSSFKGSIFGSLEADSPVEHIIVDESYGE